ECRIGRAVGVDHYQRGFHATGTVGTFGAAAACSRLLGLDAPTIAVALGIAGTQAAGLKSMFGTMGKPLHAGKASVNGLLAEGLSADDVDRVIVHADAMQLRMCAIPEPATGLAAKFSLRHTAAMVIAGEDTSAITAFTDAAAKDPAVVDVRDRIEVRDDGAT